MTPLQPNLYSGPSSSDCSPYSSSPVPPEDNTIKDMATLVAEKIVENYMASPEQNEKTCPNNITIVGKGDDLYDLPVEFIFFNEDSDNDLSPAPDLSPKPKGIVHINNPHNCDFRRWAWTDNNEILTPCSSSSSTSTLVESISLPIPSNSEVQSLSPNARNCLDNIYNYIDIIDSGMATASDLIGLYKMVGGYLGFREWMEFKDWMKEEFEGLILPSQIGVLFEHPESSEILRKMPNLMKEISVIFQKLRKNSLNLLSKHPLPDVQSCLLSISSCIEKINSGKATAKDLICLYKTIGGYPAFKQWMVDEFEGRILPDQIIKIFEGWDGEVILKSMPNLINEIGKSFKKLPTQVRNLFGA